MTGSNRPVAVLRYANLIAQKQTPSLTLHVTVVRQSLCLQQPDKVILQGDVSMDVVAAFGNGVVFDDSVRVPDLVVRSQEVAQRKMATDVV